MKKTKVEKRDGRIEEYHSAKVRGSILMAGGTADEAVEITNEVDTWVKEQAMDGPVKTTAIRNKLLEILKHRDEEVAKAFEAYKKPSH